MKGRTAGIAAVVIGLVLIALAFLRPGYDSVVRYPGEGEETARVYDGTMNTLLNPAALQDPTQPLFFTNLPVTIDRAVKTLSTADGNALLEDTQLLKGPDQNPLLPLSTTYYEIDRNSFFTVESDDPRVKPRSCGSNGEPEGCLAVTWPLGVEKKDYTGWSDDPAIPVTVAYVGEEEHAGRNTYKFQVTVSPSQIVDADTLSNFPPALPQAAFVGLAAQLGESGALDPALIGQLVAVVPQLGDPVPLAYTYATDVTYWVDPKTGILIDIDRHDVRQVALDVPGAGITPLTPVYDLNFRTSEASIQEAADDADSYNIPLLFADTILPVAGWVVGGLLIIGGLFWSMRRRTST
jgi:hypothetical protein